MLVCVVLDHDMISRLDSGSVAVYYGILSETIWPCKITLCWFSYRITSKRLTKTNIGIFGVTQTAQQRKARVFMWLAKTWLVSTRPLLDDNINAKYWTPPSSSRHSYGPSHCSGLVSVLRRLRKRWKSPMDAGIAPKWSCVNVGERQESEENCGLEKNVLNMYKRFHWDQRSSTSNCKRWKTFKNVCCAFDLRSTNVARLRLSLVSRYSSVTWLFIIVCSRWRTGGIVLTVKTHIELFSLTFSSGLVPKSNTPGRLDSVVIYTPVACTLHTLVQRWQTVRRAPVAR